MRFYSNGKKQTFKPFCLNGVITTQQEAPLPGNWNNQYEVQKSKPKGIEFVFPKREAAFGGVL